MKSGKLNGVVSLIVLFLIILCVFLFIIIGLRSINLIKLPNFIENLFYKTKNDPEIIPGDNGKIYNALHGENTDGKIIIETDISEQAVIDILSALTQPYCLFINATVNYISDDDSQRLINYKLYKKGDKFRYNSLDNNRSQELYINDTVNEYLYDYTTQKNRKNPASVFFNYDSIPFMPEINMYLDLLKNDLIIGDFKIARSETENILYLFLDIPSLKQTEEFYISLDFGIITYIRTYSQTGVIVYEYKTNEINYNFSKTDNLGFQIDDALFEIN